jgi:hypothetical protein
MLLGCESLFDFEAVSYWELYLLEKRELDEVAKMDFRIKDVLLHEEAKVFGWGHKYDYYFIRKQRVGSRQSSFNASSAGTVKRTVVDIKVEKLEEMSHKPKSNDDFRSDKKVDFETYMNNVTLAPRSSNTREAHTPSMTNRRKLRRIIKKVKSLRFYLIHKLKDVKILFNIIDKSYRKRANRLSKQAIKEIHINEYKNVKLCEIFEPKLADFLDDWESEISNSIHESRISVSNQR